MTRHQRAHFRLVILIVLAALFPACGDDDSKDTNTPSHQEQLTQAIVGTWQLDPQDKKEFIRILPTGDFGGIVIYDGLATLGNPRGQRTNVAGTWTLEGNLLTFYVIESSDPKQRGKAVQHRVLSIEGGTMETIFEDQHRMTIYRR